MKGKWDDSQIAVSTKVDRVSSVCPSGMLVYTALDGKQILQAPLDLWANVKDAMVTVVKVSLASPPSRTFAANRWQLASGR